MNSILYLGGSCPGSWTMGQSLRNHLVFVAALSLLSLGVVWPLASARAQPGGTTARGKDPRVTARNLFKEAESLRQAGKLTQALTKLQEAYQILPTPTLLWPTAELCQTLQMPIEGLAALAKYREQVAPDQMEAGQRISDVE